MSPEPAVDPRLDRAAGVRIHPAWHRLHPEFLDRPYRSDGGDVHRDEGHPASYRGVEGVPASASPPAGCIPDPGWRPQPHRWGDPGLLPVLSGLVASPVHARPRLVTQPSRVAQSRLQLPLSEAWVADESGGVHRLYRHPMAGVQHTRYANPFEWTWTNRKMRKWFCGTCAVNSRYYLWPGTLDHGSCRLVKNLEHGLRRVQLRPSREAMPAMGTADLGGTHPIVPRTSPSASRHSSPARDGIEYPPAGDERSAGDERFDVAEGCRPRCTTKSSSPQPSVI